MTEKLTPFDAAEYLDNEEAMAEYLTAMMEANDTQLTIKALGDIARAKGMAAIAKESGLGRESLYKALREGSDPKFGTIVKVSHALGLKISFEPIAH